jgi:hypothetical protein
MTQHTPKIEMDRSSSASLSGGEQNATPTASESSEDGTQSYGYDAARDIDEGEDQRDDYQESYESDAEQDTDEDEDEEDNDEDDDTLADYFQTLKLKWTPNPEKHGTDMVKITLDSLCTFSMHKNLLQEASPRLRKMTKQNKNSDIKLPDISAEEFGTIYRYLYGQDIWNDSCSIEDDSDTRSDELLWLCTLKTASALEMHDLADGIYTMLTQRIINLQHNEFGFPIDFMTELYASDQPQFKLRAFLATLAAYHLLQRDVCNRMAFLTFTQKNRNFGRDVLVEIALFSDLSCCCEIIHPSDIPRFQIPELQPSDIGQCLIHKATTAKEFKKELQFSARLDPQPRSKIAEDDGGTSLMVKPGETR